MFIESRGNVLDSDRELCLTCSVCSEAPLHAGEDVLLAKVVVDVADDNVFNDSHPL